VTHPFNALEEEAKSGGYVLPVGSNGSSLLASDFLSADGCFLDEEASVTDLART